jgi:hypothetical protein
MGPLVHDFDIDTQRTDVLLGGIEIRMAEPSAAGARRGDFDPMTLRPLSDKRLTASVNGTWSMSSTKRITSPAAPQPKHWNRFLSGLIERDGFLSLWKGQRPNQLLPFFCKRIPLASTRATRSIRLTCSMVISRSPLSPRRSFLHSLGVSAQLIEHHIPKVVQAFAKLHRIDQRPAGPVIVVQLVQILSCDQECGDPPAVSPDPDLIQPASHAQQKRAFKQIGYFKAAFQRVITSFQQIDFLGEMR